MKIIKIFFAAVLVLVGMSVSAQWNTSGTNIYNTNTGNVGIGTASPTSLLHLYSPASSSMLNVSSDWSSGNRVIGGFDLTNSSTGDLLRIALRVNGGVHEVVQTAYSVVRGGWVPYVYLNLSSGKYEMRTGIVDAEFKNSGNTSFTNPGDVYFTNNGYVGIGTSVIPTGVKLAVNGKILATEIEVQLNSEWPDYVFNEEYKLSPLSEVEQFIKENNHLPGVPSANSISKDGINLGQMNAILLQKIEELTLHMIDLQKEVEGLKNKNE